MLSYVILIRFSSINSREYKLGILRQGGHFYKSEILKNFPAKSNLATNLKKLTISEINDLEDSAKRLAINKGFREMEVIFLKV